MTTKTKLTELPWEYDHDVSAFQIHADTGDQGWAHIATIHRSDHPYISAEDAEANARLIAAAPDLLAACEAVANAASEIILLSDKSTNAGAAAFGAAHTLKKIVLPAIARAKGGAA
ncbi:MAG TPA: hypothetical protein VI457_07495 [Methylococcaceae bacterium]|nr:hypothetical protein [Methylococcaceae bacterium]